jgi:hypothetical protein
LKTQEKTHASCSDGCETLWIEDVSLSRYRPPATNTQCGACAA